MTDESKLLTMLQSMKASVRYDATELLRVQASISPAALSALKTALEDPDALVRESAASALHVHEPDEPSPEEEISLEVINVEQWISPDELPLPAGLKVVNDFNQLRFEYRLPSEHWVPGWYGLLPVFVMFWIAYRQQVVILVVISLIGLFCLVYLAVVPMVNRTSFQISREELRFQSTPLPFYPARQVPTSDVLQLGIEEKRISMFSSMQAREVPTNDLTLLSIEEKVVYPLKAALHVFSIWFYERKLYYLFFVLQDGRKLSLTDIRRGPVMSVPYEVLNYIVVHTHRWLGIKEKRIVRAAKIIAPETELK